MTEARDAKTTDWDRFHTPHCDSRFASTCGDSQRCDCGLATLRAEHDRLRAENERQAEEIARLRKREANYHDIISEMNTQIDPLPDDLQARVDAILVDCDSPQCAIVSHLSARMEAAESQAQALQAQVDSMVAPEELRQWKAEAERQRESVQALRQALGERIRSAVATEFIVRDRADKKRLGHNPSWVKVSDLQAILAALASGEAAPPQEGE